MKAMVSGHRAITQTAEERSVTMGRESPFQFTIDFEKTLANYCADVKVCQRKIPLGQRKGKRQEEMADTGSWNRWRKLEFQKHRGSLATQAHDKDNNIVCLKMNPFREVGSFLKTSDVEQEFEGKSQRRRGSAGDVGRCLRMVCPRRHESKGGAQGTLQRLVGHQQRSRIFF